MSKFVRLLSVKTGLNEFVIRRIMHTAPLRYKTFYIAKRNGSLRRIAQPSREVKLLQRVMIEELLKALPVHSSATAYSVGSSIGNNAAIHAGTGSILKIDFKDFFPSIKRSDWVTYCNRTFCIEDEGDIQLTANLFFQKQANVRTLRLAIGAPSSPILSNILLFSFDEKINAVLAGRNIHYSRYADDLTFSAPRAGYLHRVETDVRKALRELEFPKIRVNEEKTNFITARYHRVVTGLTLANDGRVTLGRNKKREIRAAVHHAVTGRLDGSKMQTLAGYLAFVNSVEPESLLLLKEKYGNEIFHAINLARVSNKV